MFKIQSEPNEDHLSCDNCPKYPRQFWSITTDKLDVPAEIILCRACMFSLVKVLVKMRAGKEI